MFEDNKDFYPTSDELIARMLEKIDLRMCSYVLEPSAGAGHIIDYCKEYYKKRYHRYMNYNTPVEKYIKFDAIEIDNRLSSILRDKGVNVVWDDFLSYEPQRFYNLIIANYPFSNGCEHMLHSIEIQERIGGKIIGLINAETIRNPYSNNRKHLLQLLDKYNAEIEYIENAFTDAIRKTNVTVAMIYIDIPMKDNETIFEREFKRDNPNLNIKNIHDVTVNRSKLEQLIFECEMIKKTGTELFKEQLKIKQLLNGMNLALDLSICKSSLTPKAINVNEFIDDINLKYWEKFISETDFKNRLPSKLRTNFTYNMEKQRDIAFNMENVMYFYEELMKAIPQSYEETVASVFDSITSKHYYSDREWEKNVYCYNGWKSNNGMKVNGRCIVSCYNNGWMYNIPEILIDLNIIFENLANEKDEIFQNRNDRELLEKIKRYEKKIETKFFILDVYKKGTMHITFKDKTLLNRFNIIAGKGKNALPPDFGTKHYSDMTQEEKDIVKNFGITIDEYILCTGKNEYLRLMA